MGPQNRNAKCGNKIQGGTSQINELQYGPIMTRIELQFFGQVESVFRKCLHQKRPLKKTSRQKQAHNEGQHQGPFGISADVTGQTKRQNGSRDGIVHGTYVQCYLKIILIKLRIDRIITPTNLTL